MNEMMEAFEAMIARIVAEQLVATHPSKATMAAWMKEAIRAYPEDFKVVLAELHSGTAPVAEPDNGTFKTQFDSMLKADNDVLDDYIRDVTINDDRIRDFVVDVVASRVQDAISDLHLRVVVD